MLKRNFSLKTGHLTEFWVLNQSFAVVTWPKTFTFGSSKDSKTMHIKFFKTAEILPNHNH